MKLNGTTMSTEGHLVDGDIASLIASGELRKRFQKAGEETVLVLKDDNLEELGGADDEDGVFEECGNITSVDLRGCPKLKSIGKRAFCGCSSLTAITIPDGVTSIGEGAFYECSSLTAITIPDGVTSIGAGAFDGCSSLTSINIPSSLTNDNIGENAFRDCPSLIPPEIAEKGHQSIVTFLNDREKRMIILGAFTRFEKAVHKAKGSEEEKVKAVRATYPKTPIDVGTLLAAMARGGGLKGGVLWELLKWMEGATEKVGKKKGKTKGSITKV